MNRHQNLLRLMTAGMAAFALPAAAQLLGGGLDGSLHGALNGPLRGGAQVGGGLGAGLGGDIDGVRDAAGSAREAGASAAARGDATSRAAAGKARDGAATAAGATRATARSTLSRTQAAVESVSAHGDGAVSGSLATGGAVSAQREGGMTTSPDGVVAADALVHSAADASAAERRGNASAGGGVGGSLQDGHIGVDGGAAAAGRFDAAPGADGSAQQSSGGE